MIILFQRYLKLQMRKHWMPVMRWTTMAQILKVFVIWLILLQVAHAEAQSVFLETPVPLNVTVGNIADFNCTVSGIVTSVFFLINDTSLIMLDDENIMSVVMSGGLTILNIKANVEYNNTVIECGAFSNGEEFRTDPVLLRVQGLLAAPGNPHTFNRNGSIHQPVVLRWDAPFSLDITGVDPDISNYTVFITNVNTSRNGSVTVTGTEFEFTNLTEEDPNPCYYYVFTVTAVNMAGEGNSSDSAMGNIQRAPQAVPADRVDVTLTFNEQNRMWTISMDCELTLLDCPGREPEVFMVRVANDDDTAGCVHSDMTAEPIGEGRLRISFTEDERNLISDEFYSAVIFAINSAGNTSSNGVVNFTTFDLQNVIIHLNETFMCQYIGGSVAQGCLVITRQNNNIVYAILRIQEDARMFMFAAESGEIAYEILGFDLEQNGMFGTQAAVNQTTPMMGILVQEFDNSAISEATVAPEDGGMICTNCTFIVGSDATGCVVILHALENMQELLSHTISRDGSGTFAQGCFPVFSSGNFSLAIFAVGSNGPLGTAPGHVQNITILVAATTPTSAPTVQPNDSNTALIAGVIVAVAVIVVITAIIVCLVYYKKKKNLKEATVEMSTVVIEIPQDSPSSYRRMDERPRVMPDSDSPMRDDTQNRSKNGSPEPPEIPPQNFDTKDVEIAAKGQQHGLANSQYSLLQPAGDIEAPPPAYDTVAPRPSNPQDSSNTASGGFYDVVRDPNAKPKEKQQYAELSTVSSDQPLPQPPQEVPVKYDYIISQEHQTETQEGADYVSDPKTKQVKHYAQLKLDPSDRQPPPPSQEVPVQYAQLAQLQNEAQSTNADSIQEDAIFDEHSETRQPPEQELPPPIPPREGRGDTPPAQPSIVPRLTPATGESGHETGLPPRFDSTLV